MNPQSFGKYQLLKKLATGGMAEVWLARQMGIEGFQKNLVVKRILPHLAEDREFVEMFRNEALIAARFNHPNIAQVYEFGEANGTYYIAMEFIHGEDLGRVIRKAASAGQWVAQPLAIRIVAAACEGLYYAHSRTDEAGRPLRVVHRDISPQNILISFDGSVKLVDFGIAKAADQASLTKSGAIKGKFAYMAPEQAVGKPLDGRADIFAIGLVLYEMLTSVRPLKRDSELATLQAAMECAIAPPSQVARVADVPKELDPVVMRAVAKNADDRYSNARQFQRALEDFLVGQRLVVGSEQISELMETLFADRLAEEKAQGQVLPVDDDSLSSGTPRPPFSPQEKGRSKASAAADMDWDVPPGEPSQRERSRASAASHSLPPRRTASVAAPVVAPEDSHAREAVRRPSNPHGTQGARAQSRSDLGRTPTGEAPLPRRSSPSLADTLPEPTPSRSRSHKEEDDDERTRLPPPPEPSHPPRRRTGMQSSGQPAVEAPRQRTPSRAASRSEMPAPPPRRSSGPARAVRVEDEVVRVEDEAVDRAIKASSQPPRRVMAARTVATVGLLVGLIAVVAVFHKPILAALNKPMLAVLNDRAVDGQGVLLTIKTNEKVKVSVRHTERCRSAQPVTELGLSPMTKVSGAHLRDTLILENEQQGLYKEDRESLADGEPGQVKVIAYEFRRGHLQLTLKPEGLRGITVRRNGQDVGTYSGSKGLKMELMEGRHKLELNGGPLREPFLFEVDIKPGIINKETQDLSGFLG